MLQPFRIPYVGFTYKALARVAVADILLSPFQLFPIPFRLPPFLCLSTNVLSLYLRHDLILLTQTHTRILPRICSSVLQHAFSALIS
jgi:hypothetical protein